MRGASIGIFIILAVIGAAISGCIDTPAKEIPAKGPYSYVPGPVNPNPDMGDPYKVVEEAVDAIKANDYKAFERLLSPEFKAQIGGDENLKQLVQEQHDKMFEKRVTDIIDIKKALREENKFYIDANGRVEDALVVKVGKEFHIEEW